MTLSQRLRHVTKRINWLKTWSSWDGDHNCVFVHVTDKYIHFALGYHPDKPPSSLTYSLVREEWEGQNMEHHSLMVENETCWCRRKAGDKIDDIARRIENCLSRMNLK